MSSARVPGWVWGVLVGTHALVLAWVLRHNNWGFPDSDRYLEAAKNLWLYGELYARPWLGNAPRGQAVQEFTIRPLGYPLVVLGLGATTGRPVLLLVVQNLLSLLNVGLVLNWWAVRTEPARNSWVVAVVAVLSFPAQFIYANAVMSELPLQTVVLALLWAGLRFIRTGQKRYFAGAAGAAVAALLLKPVFYPLAIGLAGLGLVMAWPRRRWGLAFIGMVPMVVVGSYMTWNWQRTGYFHFSSIAEINLLHYNAAGVVRQVEGPLAEEQWVAGVLREANAAPTFAARQQLIQARAGAVLWAHPVVYARQHVQGMAALFLDPGRFDISQLLGLAPLAGGGLLAQVRAGGLLRALGHLPWKLLSLLAVVLLANVGRLVLAGRGFWRLANGGPEVRKGRWVAVGLLLYVALLTGPLGAARFLVPVWPLLLALALVGLERGGPPTEVLAAKDAPPVRENERES